MWLKEISDLRIAGACGYLAKINIVNFKTEQRVEVCDPHVSVPFRKTRKTNTVQTAEVQDLSNTVLHKRSTFQFRPAC